MRLHFVLEALAEANIPLYSNCARHHACLALDRATAALASAQDKSRLERRADWIEAR